MIDDPLLGIRVSRRLKELHPSWSWHQCEFLGFALSMYVPVKGEDIDQLTDSLARSFGMKWPEASAS